MVKWSLRNLGYSSTHQETEPVEAAPKATVSADGGVEAGRCIHGGAAGLRQSVARLRAGQWLTWTWT